MGQHKIGFTAALLLASSLGAGTASASCDIELADLDPIIRQIPFQSGADIRIPVETTHSEALPWILRKDGREIRRSQTHVFGLSEGSGTSVHQVSLGALEQAGDYTIEICGSADHHFSVADQPYGTLRDDSLRYFYLNRAGMDIVMPQAGGEAWTRKAGHLDETVTCFHGRDRKDRDWPNCSASYDVSGGWYDAGDYGKYSVPAGHTIWLLLNAYERAIAAGASPDAPDMAALLDEVRWGLDWLLSMQVPDGTRLKIAARSAGAEDGSDAVSAAAFEDIDASGLVFAKVHERQWLTLPLLPADAKETRYVYPPTTASALNLAGAAAMAARIWAEIDPDYAAVNLSAAKRAYAAAKRHPDILAINDFDGGGGYGDRKVSDEFTWAATELYLTTQEPKYEKAMKKLRRQRGPSGEASGVSDLGWAAADLQSDLSLTAHSATPDKMRAKAKAVIIQMADQYLSDAALDGYFIPYQARAYTWGSNGSVASRGIVLLEAYRLTGKAAYRQSADEVLGYLAGQNPLATSYIAGHGETAVRHVHHRFWAQGADPDFPPAPPGALSGGPNVRSPADPVAAELIKTGCAPQKCWTDHVDAYALNEVAIYWNAALFSLVDGLNRREPNP